MLNIKKTLISTDKGDYIRYTPVLTGQGDCVTVGELSFASYDVEVGEPPAKHEQAIVDCKANARKVLYYLADTF